MDRFLRAASLLFTGIFAGFLVGVLVLENSLRGYGAEVYTQVRQVELDSLDTLASITLAPAILTTVVLAIRAQGNDRRHTANRRTRVRPPSVHSPAFVRWPRASSSAAGRRWRDLL